MNLEEAKACATFGPRLCQLRKARGWTQRHLAKMSGLQLQSIGEWERRINLPRYEALVVLADAFEVTLDELMRGKP